MVFNPEDEQDFGPHCRNCHRGSSRCTTCHNTSGTGAITGDKDFGANNAEKKSYFRIGKTTTDDTNTVAHYVSVASGGTAAGAENTASTTYGFFKKSRTTDWPSDWRTTSTQLMASVSDTQTIAGADVCSDDGFSWPHRTLGWKMLKDDLFGLDFDGSAIAVGDSRTYAGLPAGNAAHDIDSVCLDCHNPTVWNDGQAASKAGHVDTTSTADDNHNDELITRGLP